MRNIRIPQVFTLIHFHSYLYFLCKYKQIIKKSKLETQKSDPHLKIAFIFRRVTSGTRTHDIQNHNLTL